MKRFYVNFRGVFGILTNRGIRKEFKQPMNAFIARFHNSPNEIQKKKRKGKTKQGGLVVS